MVNHAMHAIERALRLKDHLPRTGILLVNLKRAIRAASRVHACYPQYVTACITFAEFR